MSAAAQLNRSVSKQQFSIPKSERFPAIKLNYKQNLSASTLDKVSDFDKIVRKGKILPQTYKSRE